MGANGCGRERTCNRICNRKLWEIAKTGGHGIGVGISFASTGLPDLQSSVNDVSPNMVLKLAGLTMNEWVLQKTGPEKEVSPVS